jgi:hypothetical protein
MNPDTPQPQVFSNTPNPVDPNPSPVSQQVAVNSKNSLALPALILSLIGVLIFIAGIVGFILGIVALKRSKNLNGNGRGISIASIIIGFITGFLWAIILVVFIAIPALQKDSWNNTNLSSYKTIYSNISNNYEGISSDFSSISNTPAANFKTSSLDPTLVSQTQTDCMNLQKDASSLKSLPTYPVPSTNSQLKSAAATMSQAASDCLSGLDQSSVNLINQSASELLSGSNSLASANKTITATK